MEAWLIAMLVMVVILIGLLLYFRFFYSPSSTVEPGVVSDNVYTPNVVWSKESVAPGATCRSFTFPTTSVRGEVICGINDTENVTFLQMPSPTYDTQTLNSMLSESKDPTACVDVDQLNAIEVFRTCTQGSTDTSETWCPKADGTLADYGETYTYYTACTSDADRGQSLYCAGNIGVISIGGSCISGSGTLTTCLPSDESQQFRIVRTADPNVHPVATLRQGSSGNTGMYMALVHRATGLCLMPPTNRPIYGDDVVLRECSENNNGYVWALIQPLLYPVSANGQFNESGTLTATSPAQLTYIGATTNPNIQLNRSNGTSIGAFLTDYQDNYTLSMRASGNIVTLGPYQTCDQESGAVTCNNTTYRAELLTFAGYNAIAMANACAS